MGGNKEGVKQKYKDHAKIIISKCTEYDQTRPILDFLRGIAHNFQLQV
jgi:hypothetical protein